MFLRNFFVKRRLFVDDSQGHSVLNTRVVNQRSHWLTRRKFCNRLSSQSTGLVWRREFESRPADQHGSLVAYPPMKIDGAERIMPGSFLYFSYPSAKNPAVLVRGLDGEYFAHSRKCAHRGCSVDYDAVRRCLNCPCHQGAYDARTGYVLYGPPPWPLDPIVLKMRGGEVWAVGRTVGRGDAGA